MFVDVIRLRRAGAKLSDADVKIAVPVRGHLCNWSYTAGYRTGKAVRVDAVTRTATGDASGSPLLPPPHHFRVTRFKGFGMVLVGLEEIGTRRNHIEEYPQAWFCRPAFGAPESKTPR